MTEPQPCRDKVRITLLPTPQLSTHIIAPTQETVIRRATITAIGPDVNERFGPEDQVEIGQTVLVNIMSAQQFGDEDYIVPVGALLATLTE